MRLQHPTDSRLSAEVSSDAGSPVVELWLVGDQEPTVRFAADEDEGWEPGCPIFWQAVDLLCSLGFVTISEIANVLDGAEQSKASRSRRLHVVAEVVAALRLACE